MKSKVAPTTVTIDEDGIRNSVSVDRATASPTAKKTPTKDNSPKTYKTKCEQEETYTVEQKWKKKYRSYPQEYAEDCIVRYVGRGYTVKYVVRQYGYRPVNDTLEPPAQISEHFFPRIRRRRGKQDTRRQRRENYLGDDKDCTTVTVQASTLMNSYRQKANKYRGYMVRCP